MKKSSQYLQNKSTFQKKYICIAYIYLINTAFSWKLYHLLKLRELKIGRLCIRKSDLTEQRYITHKWNIRSIIRRLNKWRRVKRRRVKYLIGLIKEMYFNTFNFWPSPLQLWMTSIWTPLDSRDKLSKYSYPKFSCAVVKCVISLKWRFQELHTHLNVYS